MSSPEIARRWFFFSSKKKLKELSESIEKNGLIQPIIVRKGKKKFELVAGERRLKACKLVGIDKIPAIVSDFDDRKAFESGLIENLQREDLTSIEEGEGYNRLMNEFNYTQEELAIIVSKSRSHVANLLRLISLPKEVKKFILDGKLSLGHARCLVGYVGAVNLAKRIVKEDLSVRYVESLFYKKDLDKKTKNLFRDIFRLGKGKNWTFSQSSLFLDFLAGNQNYKCTPWGNPTRNIFGWQKPCYLLGEGYVKTFDELMNKTEWDKYGTGNYEKCANCMVHCGYEPTAAEDSIKNPLKAFKVALFGPKTEGDMVDEIPLKNQRPAEYVFEKQVSETVKKIKETEVSEETVFK